MDKLLSIYIMPRANLKGIIDLIPIVKSHIQGFPDILHIFISQNLIEKSENAYLFLRIIKKIDQHFKIFLETCYEIHFRPSKDLDILNKIYLEQWSKNHDLIPPERRRIVEKQLYEWLKKEDTEIQMDDLNFFKKYFKMAINTLDWTKKKRLWRDLNKREKNQTITETKKQIIINKNMIIWKKYSHKVFLPDTMALKLRNELIISKKDIKTLAISRIGYEQLKFCPICGADAVGNFCANCGYDLRVKRGFCKNCGFEIDRDSVKFCPQCGEKL